MDPKIAALNKAVSSAQLKAAVDAISLESEYYTAEIRDLILQKQNLIHDAPSADAVVSFLKEFSDEYSKRDLLRTAEIRDLVIDVLAPKISEDEPVENFGRLICRIVFESEPASKRYSNRKSFTAILDCFHRATSAGSGSWISGAIYDICGCNPGANKILNDLPFVESYSAIIPHATTDLSV